MDGTGKQFMEMTKYQNMGDAPYRQGAAQPPLEWPAEGNLIPLPEAEGLGNEPLIKIIEQRRSLRNYSGEPIDFVELSYLLWCCQGVQKENEKNTMRTVPSAGARHAFETYILANRVEGLEKGLYRYVALKGALTPVTLDNGIAVSMKEACLGQGMIETSAVTVCWVAEVMRMVFRYGERGYRYLHLDAGHACQNLYLAAEAIGCGACAIGAFDDDKLNAVMGLDGVERFAVYGASVGKKP